MADMSVANTILEQLGGRQFITMTGARHLLARDNGLTFRLPGGRGFCKDGINYVTVTLTAMDDYTVEFFRIRGANVTGIEQNEGVYAENLKMVFTEATGLRTRL